jgi:hypothetical protein
MLPSADALSIYGLPKSSAIYIQNNHWKLDKDYSDIFQSYYLLHWCAAYFQSSMIEGTIEREGVVYQVIYYRCNAAAIGHSSSKQLLMSFRELQKEYKAMPVVLVTIA